MKMLDGHGWIPDYVAVVRRSDLLAPTKDDLINKTPLVVLAAAKIGTTRLIDNVKFFNVRDTAPFKTLIGSKFAQPSF